jgi:DNA-binding PadR family transcriptional regulator
MNVSKFLVLGTLGLQGESSGYDVVQYLRETRVERWTDVKIGSIYYAIGKLQENEAIEEVRKERQGKQPEKTIYRITPEGEERFKSMQEEAFQGLYPQFYGFKLALKFNVHRTAGEIASFAETAIQRIDEYLEAMDSYLHSLDDAQRRERSLPGGARLDSGCRRAPRRSRATPSAGTEALVVAALWVQTRAVGRTPGC